MRIRPRFFIGVGLIAPAIGYLIFSSIRTTSEYYLTVPEVAARESELGGQAIRVAGRVKPGNIDGTRTRSRSSLKSRRFPTSTRPAVP